MNKEVKREVHIRSTKVEHEDKSIFNLVFIKLNDHLTPDQIHRIDSFDVEATLDFMDKELVGLTINWYDPAPVAEMDQGSDLQN